MSSTLLAIATFLTLIGGVIFGVSRFEKRSQDQEVELVGRTDAAPVAPDPGPATPAEAPAAPIAVEQGSEPVVEAVSEPVIEDALPLESSTELPSEPTQTTLDLGPIADSTIPDETATVDEAATETPVNQLTLDLTPVAEPTEPVMEALIAETVSEPVEDDVEDDYVEPRSQVEAFAIAPTIQDPKRPNSDELDNLTQDILTWGKSRDLKYVSKLTQCATHRDPIIRGHAAAALGEIAARHSLDRTVESIIPVLGKLTQDSNLQVRQFAVKSLGEIRSPKVLPYLEQALRSPSNGVKKAAQTALGKLKLGYQKRPLVTVINKVKPKA